jgi:hypothetical protein
MVVPLCIYGQEHHYFDRLYLKDGSRLNGKIIKYDGVNSVVFVLAGGDTIQFDQKMIKKISMYTSSFHEEEPFHLKSPNYYIRAQLSLLFSKENKGASLSISSGAQINHWYSAGLGVGIDNYYLNEGFDIIPVFGEMKFSLFKKNTSPYIGLRSGYGFKSADESVGQTAAKGGWFFNPVFGYRLGASKPFIDLFAGAKFQSLTYSVIESSSSSEFDIKFRRYDFGIGITF